MDEMINTAMGPVPATSENQVKVVYISIALDVMEALVENTVDGSLYMFDNNSLDGSKGQGTAQLQTVLQPGDTVSWVISGLEVETLTGIKSITGPAVEACGIYYIPAYGLWTGVVKEGYTGPFEYTLEIQVESKTMVLSSKPSVVITLDQNSQKEASS